MYHPPIADVDFREIDDMSLFCKVNKYTTTEHILADYNVVLPKGSSIIVIIFTSVHSVR